MSLPTVSPQSDASVAGKPEDNGSTGPSKSRLPGRSKKGRSKTMLILLVVAVAVVITLPLYYFLRMTKAPFNGPTWKVKREKLVVTIVERGALESADNKEYSCKVKAKSQNGVATTIKWLVDDGSFVRGPRSERPEGDKLVELDDSALQESLTDQKIKVSDAEAVAVKADGDYEVAMIENENDIKQKLTNLQIAQLNLAKWIGKNWRDEPISIAGSVCLLSGGLASGPFQSVAPLLAITKAEGDYQAKLEDNLGKIDLAQSDRDGWLERASWSRRMWKLGFMSKTQADSDQSRLDSAEYSLHKLETDLNTLKNYERTVTEADLRSKVGTAYRDLKKAYIAADANRAKADSERRTKRSIYQQQVQKQKDIEAEIGKCKLYATKDGLAVYYIPESTRGGFGKQSLVQVGENVSEGQKLLLIPDLTRMQVNTRVHEAMVSRVIPGQKAQVRIDALPGHVLKGKVLSVKNVPSAQDWLSSDVRVYETKVAIDENVEELKLKPGLSSEVTIFADESSGEVLTIPIQSVVGNIRMGAKRKCFVIGPDRQPVERDIVVGMNNDTSVEVTSGLEEGEEVIMNPLPLLTDRSMKPGVPMQRQQSEGGGPSGGKGGKGKGGKGLGGKGPGGPGGMSPGGRPPGGAGGGFDPAKRAQWQEKLKNMTPEQKKALIEKFKGQRGPQ